jgi:hypothetical protein
VAKYETTHSLIYGGPLSEFDADTDRLYEALLRLEGIEDPDLAAVLATGDVDVILILEADTFEDAVCKGICDLRAAIHEIGGATPGWEKYIQEIAHGARVLA